MNASTTTTESVIITNDKQNTRINNNNNNKSVHIFYYAWYRNKEHDSSYDHWNHKVLPHWTSQINSQYRNIGQQSNVKNNEIGANFYPKIGLYSSLDEQTVRYHLSEIRDKAHVNTIIVSYWGGRGDENISSEEAHNEHTYLTKLFQIAEELGNMYIVFHLEPYKDRTAQSTLEDIKFLIDTYGKSRAFYRARKNSLLSTTDHHNSNTNHNSDSTHLDTSAAAEIPLFYIYDSYLIAPSEWKRAIISNMIRSSSYDSILIGLYTDKHSSERFMLESDFDGFYTYFGATGFTYGSTPSNWNSMHDFAMKNNKIFIPSVAPGYIDERIRPWNSQNTRQRNNGKYYDDMWKNAIKSSPPIVSVTSYNEWHEGTQIEPAIPARYKSSLTNRMENYLDYSPNEPDYYLTRTAYWVDTFLSSTP